MADPTTTSRQNPIFITDTGTGLGDFAPRAIATGEVVELAPVLLLDLQTEPFSGARPRPGSS